MGPIPESGENRHKEGSGQEVRIVCEDGVSDMQRGCRDLLNVCHSGDTWNRGHLVKSK